MFTLYIQMHHFVILFQWQWGSTESRPTVEMYCSWPSAVQRARLFLATKFNHVEIVA